MHMIVSLKPNAARRRAERISKASKLTRPYNHLQGYDLIEDMYSAKTAAMNLVSELCKQRTKSTLDPFMRFIVQVMTEYQVIQHATLPQCISTSLQKIAITRGRHKIRGRSLQSIRYLDEELL